LAKDNKTKEERYQIVRDFMLTNKEAVRFGCVNAKENSQFRATHGEISRKVYAGNESGQMNNSNSNNMNRHSTKFPSDMVFGQPHRPSTPIQEVLEHKFLYDWLDLQRTQQSQRVEAEKQALKAISGAYHTKSSWLKNAKIPVDERPLWKMDRFRNVNAAVDSFRNDKQRFKALSAHNIDSIPRQGANNFKQGIYNVNKTTLPC
jgi:hypothetical protein